MQGIIGLILSAVGGVGSWWFFRNIMEDGAFNWGQPIFLLIGVVGLVLLSLYLREWWMAD